MKNLVAYFDRHPFQAALLVVAMFCAVSAMDHNDQARAEAYQAGLIIGVQLATDTGDASTQQQLVELCNQEWENTPNAELAKKRACRLS